MELQVDNKAIEQLVREHIRIEVMKALSGQSDYLIGRLVDEALAGKRNSYDSETILQKMIGEMIRKAANEAAQEWLVEQQPKIKKLVHASLGKKSDGLVASVAEQLVAGFAKGINVKVWLGSED
jgi:hypothetical protein